MVKLFVSPGVQFLMSFENYGCGIDNKTRKAQALKKDRPLHVHFLFSRWMANTHFRGTRPDIEMVYKKTVGRVTSPPSFEPRVFGGDVTPPYRL